MKNKVLLISAAILLLIFLFFGTYAWYIFFLSGGSIDKIDKDNGLKSGDIVLDDSGSSVYTDAESMDEGDINSVIPYKFIVKNKSSREGKFNLYIEDLPANAVNDGCTSETLLNRNQLKFQLKADGKILLEDYLSNVKDNILYTDSIDGNDSINYELRIYIHEDADDWEEKHYHYKILLNKES